MTTHERLEIAEQRLTEAAVAIGELTETHHGLNRELYAQVNDRSVLLDTIREYEQSTKRLLKALDLLDERHRTACNYRKAVLEEDLADIKTELRRCTERN